MKGYIYLYAGNGKGETAVAHGLALRTAGAGEKVFMEQFVIGMPYAELDALKRFPEIELKQYGQDCFIENQPTKEHIQSARKGHDEVTSIILENQSDMVFLDKVCFALYFHLFETQLSTSIQLKKNGINGNYPYWSVCSA